MLSKRKLFIGSSSEAYDKGIPTKVKELIENCTELSNIQVVIWKDTVWENLETAVKTLTKNIEEYYYAVFIGFPDDKVETRGKTFFTTRDNTTFEFGLFLSRFGSERTFFFSPVYSNKAYEFNILSDIGKSPFVHPYLLKINDDKFEFKDFINPDAFLKLLKIEEGKIDGSKSKYLNLDSTVENLKTEIYQISDDDEQVIISKLKNSLDFILYSKKQATEHNIKDIVCDVLDTIKDVKDFCKPRQLAQLQRHDNGVVEVWVFADKPLEFQPKDANNPDLELLKQTVKENLKNDVKYVYFVSSKFDENHIYQNFSYDTELLKNLQIEFIEPRFFQTFFTLHFKEQNGFPDTIYMSSLLPHRNDLLIQVSHREHKERIFERIQKIKGLVDTTKGYKKVDYTVNN